MSLRRCWTTLMAAACLLTAAANFVAVELLSDGEVETRVRFNGVTAKETSVGGNARYAPLLLPKQAFNFSLLAFEVKVGVAPCMSWLEFLWPERQQPRESEKLSKAYLAKCLTGSRCSVVRLLAPHLGEPGPIPGGFTPRFSHVEIVLDDTAGRWVFSGISRFPRTCIPALLHAHLTSPLSVFENSMLRAVQIAEFLQSLFAQTAGGSGPPRSARGSSRWSNHAPLTRTLRTVSSSPADACLLPSNFHLHSTRVPGGSADVTNHAILIVQWFVRSFRENCTILALRKVGSAGSYSRSCGCVCLLSNGGNTGTRYMSAGKQESVLTLRQRAIKNNLKAFALVPLRGTSFTANPGKPLYEQPYVPTEFAPDIDPFNIVACSKRGGGERLACSPPTKAIRVQSPAGPLGDFCMWESCRTMPLVGGFSRGSAVSPVLSFRRCSILTSITFIDCQDLYVKSRPNLFPHSEVSAVMQRRRKREIPEKTHQPVASSDMIPTREIPASTPPGIGPCSPRAEACSLTTTPPRDGRCVPDLTTCGTGVKEQLQLHKAMRPQDT
ncbi:hypothetical protein PR048_014679 [Dryococelus australis]|uniref:Transmembrane protein n=1 Tax=Dryococelus australis TaxID=614101 RepID=A0ABQ9HF53_9NEOP|nr:hypothetical protein PR048_014679 [Dryococelus australis]